MPRKSAGARLYQRAKGRGAGYWVIRDGGRFVSTGTRDRREAESKLAAYIAQRDRPAGPSTPDRLTVADVLDIYGREHAPTVRAPETIGYSIKALLPLLGALPVGSISGEVCRRYAKSRDRSPGTTRREMGVLQAAINYAHAEGYLTAPVKVKLPAMPAARDRWLTRDEAARLLRAAYRNPKAKHLARFILVALYTGTRSDAILRLGFMPNTVGGWVDTDRGVLYRRGGRRGGDQEAHPGRAHPAPLAGPSAAMGAPGRLLRGRGRGAARGQPKDGLAHRTCGIGHRPLHPPRSATHRRDVGHAARRRQVGGGRFLWPEPQHAGVGLRASPPRSPALRSRGHGAKSMTFLCTCTV